VPLARVAPIACLALTTGPDGVSWRASVGSTRRTSVVYSRLDALLDDRYGLLVNGYLNECHLRPVNAYEHDAKINLF
jgi:hypothetical protein